jgi:multiple sugar transport system permease protein/putative aldouronate transport system permease protein
VLVLVVTLFFSGGIIPTFLLVSDLGGYQQYWALILPSAVSVFNILVLRAFFSNTAQELIDAARVDGADHWRTMWSIVLPTSKAVLAVITLFYAVGYWNSFFNALLFLPDNGKWPLQMVIYTYTLLGNKMPGTGITGTGQYAGHQVLAPLSIQMAVVTLTLLPIIVAYPFVQRHLTKGMLVGAIKG